MDELVASWASPPASLARDRQAAPTKLEKAATKNTSEAAMRERCCTWTVSVAFERDASKEVNEETGGRCGPGGGELGLGGGIVGGGEGGDGGAGGGDAGGGLHAAVPISHVSSPSESHAPSHAPPVAQQLTPP
eukprot:CAMPEP_0181205862 /NCGR_PEP_ID=MMETSP1096-20121128/20709_1 /TAXON_ID=156174 ORGANISM="Chrysochromulina ericina, Strain CCMP281" /NCGR_SAMPLE_ID=MMETSP1096 /ASSEMBLY_ACC=CAM_ASM_000453 /LENGTH=132 /DNA_ID=CAMNT_0023296685 /DNA_START=415 /DNA_END=811 /DNA_ORIENTATION=-